MRKFHFFQFRKITKITPEQGSVHIVDGQNEVTDPNAEFALLIKFFGLDPSLIEFEYNESKGFYCLGTWDYESQFMISIICTLSKLSSYLFLRYCSLIQNSCKLSVNKQNIRVNLEC